MFKQTFILEDINIPVLLVGSQRSSDRGSSDDAMNLICAAKFISKTDFVGVAICMHGKTDDKFCDILPACKTKKLHTSRRDAFKPINDVAIAKVDYKGKKIEFLKRKLIKDMKYDAKLGEKILELPKLETRIDLLKERLKQEEKASKKLQKIPGLEKKVNSIKIKIKDLKVDKKLSKKLDEELPYIETKLKILKRHLKQDILEDRKLEEEFSELNKKVDLLRLIYK